jgi:hypothetical protein
MMPARPQNITLGDIWDYLSRLENEFRNLGETFSRQVVEPIVIPLDIETARSEMSKIRRVVEALPQYEDCYDCESTLREAIRRSTDKAKIAEYEQMLHTLPVLNSFLRNIEEVKTIRAMRDEWRD